MWRVVIVGVLAACSAPAAPAPPRVVPDAGPVAVGPPPAALVAALDLSPVYTKYVDAGGLPVLGSARVQDAALREAAFLVRKMIGHRPEVVRAMADAGVRVVVMATTELTTDVPEHGDLVPKDYWDRRARGLGATMARPATSCGEENLLHLSGDPYYTENILIHELSHTVHEIGMAAVDATFQTRLEEAFAHAREAGLWAGTYAMTNVSEYWAEAAQSWFDTNRTNDFDHGTVATRERVRAYDPDVAALLTEVYGADAWRYQYPEARGEEERAHLAGYDRTARFEWPEGVGLEPLALVAADPGASPHTVEETSISFINRRADDVSVLWIDFDGARVPYATIGAGRTHVQSTFVGHTWAVHDASGATLGHVVAASADGFVNLDP